MKKETIIILMCMLLVLPVINAQGQGITPELDRKFENAGTNEKVEVIVVTNERPSQAQINEISSEGNISERFEIVNAVTVSVPRQAAEAIANRPFVKRVEPNYNVSTVLDESSSIINANQVWETNTTGEGVDVSIIDTGIDNNNENVQTELEKDFTGEGNDDLNGHGTHVAGIVSSDDSTYRGIAPESDLFDAKALTSDGSGTASDVISAIEWSVENNADVISLSLGAKVDSCDGNDILSEAVDKAVSQGTVAVVAAGNDGPDSETITVPGCSQRAITVGASDGDGNVEDFSSRGPTADGRVKPDVVAPGVGISSTWNDGSFESLSGTSMATPHVSGVAALMLSENSELKTSEIKETIISNSSDLGLEPNTQGGGRVDALESYESIKVNETKETRNNETEQNGTERNETEEDSEGNETRNNVTGLPPGLANKTSLPLGLENRSTLPPGLRRKASAGPGSFAYGLDRAFEKINLALTFNETKKVQKRLEFAEERLAEAQVAAARGKPEKAQKAIENYNQMIEKAEKSSEKSGNPRIGKMVENSTEKNKEVLREVPQKVPEQAKKGISKAMNNASNESNQGKRPKNNESKSPGKKQVNPERENESGSSSQAEANSSAEAKGSVNSKGNSGQKQASVETSSEASANANVNTDAKDNPGTNGDKPENDGSDLDDSSENSGSTTAPAPTSSGKPESSGNGQGAGNKGKGPGSSGN